MRGKWLPLVPILAIIVTPCQALSKNEVRAIIEAAYPGARITEVEREIWQGQKIYEVDFRHGGRKLEGIISLEGEILSVHDDD